MKKFPPIWIKGSLPKARKVEYPYREDDKRFNYQFLAYGNNEYLRNALIEYQPKGVDGRIFRVYADIEQDFQRGIIYFRILVGHGGKEIRTIILHRDFPYVPRGYSREATLNRVWGYLINLSGVIADGQINGKGYDFKPPHSIELSSPKESIDTDNDTQSVLYHLKTEDYHEGGFLVSDSSALITYYTKESKMSWEAKVENYHGYMQHTENLYTQYAVDAHKTLDEIVKLFLGKF